MLLGARGTRCLAQSRVEGISSQAQLENKGKNPGFLALPTQQRSLPRTGRNPGVLAPMVSALVPRAAKKTQVSGLPFPPALPLGPTATPAPALYPRGGAGP